jgi:hypothetical protein
MFQEREIMRHGALSQRFCVYVMLFIWISWCALLARTRDDVCRSVASITWGFHLLSAAERERRLGRDIMREESVHEAMRLDN